MKQTVMLFENSSQNSFMAPQSLLVLHINDDDMNWMLQWQYSHGAYFFSKNCYIFIFCSLHGFMRKLFVEFCCHWHFWIPFNSMKWNLPTHSLCLKKNAVDMFYSRKKNRAGHGHISNFLNLGKFVCIVWTFLSSECKKKSLSKSLLNLNEQIDLFLRCEILIEFRYFEEIKIQFNPIQSNQMKSN